MTSSEPYSNQTGPANVPQDELIGTILLEQYEVIEKLGQGGMAVVYKCRQVAVERQVAIKTLLTVDPTIVARFEREVKTLSKLKHRNIVQALDCLVDPGSGRVFFVMEYLDGIILDKFIKQCGMISDESTLAGIFSQLCDALSFAHDRGVIHRDLKPENIVLVKEDGQSIVKILDFGIAKVQEEMQQLTKTGVAVGSPIYMSPEQCMGRPVDQRTDVYSLGVLLFEATTGEVPYLGSNITDTLTQHCDPNVTPAEIEKHNQTVTSPKQLNAIICKAMSTEPGDRFSSIGEMKQALEFWRKCAQTGNVDADLPSFESNRASAAKPASATPKGITTSEEIALNQLSRRNRPASFASVHDDPDTQKAMAMLETGESLVGKLISGRYLIADTIGEGAMAVVYKATDQTSGKTVAIKSLKYNQPDLANRFALEMRVHSRLKHPNIVEAIEMTQTDGGNPLFVMEYLAGISIETLIEDFKFVRTVKDICSILSQLLDAVEYAHEMGVIHRDIKPENIILQQGTVLKVLDFGVAKIQEDLQKLTKTGVVLGTPAYMSPEQCVGNKLDNRSDIYSLGVVAYEMITGKLPFDSDNTISLMELHCDPSIPPPPVSRYRKEIPAVSRLSVLFEKFLATDKDSRYQSIAELKHDLDDWWRVATNAGKGENSPFNLTPIPKSTRSTTGKQTEKIAATDSSENVESLHELVQSTRKSEKEAFASSFEDDNINERTRNPATKMYIVGTVLFFLLIAGLIGAIALFEKLRSHSPPKQATHTQKTKAKTPTKQQTGTGSKESEATVTGQPPKKKKSNRVIIDRTGVYRPR